MTLLEKAKACSAETVGRKPTLADELIDLAIEVANGNIHMTQAAKAMGMKPTAANAQIRSTLYSALRRGIIRVERVKPQ